VNPSDYDLWQPVIGLEIHVQLQTKSKLFSSAPNRFGDEPNTNITDVCTGQPGTLPVLNKEAVHKAVQFGSAVKAHIARYSCFDRKSYFYPDSPRNYQITQFFHPILRGGVVCAEVAGSPHHFFINRAHLEDDSGMLKHFSSFAGIDYNRAGAPLLEVVSEPCIHSPEEASAYAKAIREIMLYLGACDGNMEEGSFRMDVNVSVRLKTEEGLRPKIEIKNMNSFSNMEIALREEIRRQIDLYTEHPTILPKELLFAGTYRFDPESKKVLPMRRKEEAHDYRYFPEPDLVPLILSEEYIEEVTKRLPELPWERYQRYRELGLTKDTARTLIDCKPLGDFFHASIPWCHNAKMLANWILVEFTGRVQSQGQTLQESALSPQYVATLVNMVEEGTITGKIAKNVADEMLLYPTVDPRTIVQNNPDYQPLADTSFLEGLVVQVLKDNASSIADYLAGKQRAFDYLVGQVMKLCKGKASPSAVHALLQDKLREYS